MAREHQKMYSNRKHRPKTFKVGKRLMLKVSPWKWIICFGKQGKLGPRYNSPLVMLEQVGDQAYRLELPPELKGIHDVFHVCYLRKFLAEEPSVLPLDEL